MIDDNPYRPPDTPNIRRTRPLKEVVRPVMHGLFAIIVATLIMGIGGLLCSIFGVGSWWVYKFWLRNTEPVEDETRAFLQGLEERPAVRPGKPAGDPDLQAFENLLL
jgi:hypothetical protein